MPEEPSTSNAKSAEPTAGWLDKHMEIVKNRILERASELAEAEKCAIEPRHISEAAKVFAPGIELPPKKEGWPASITAFFSAIFAWSPSITTVSALLAVVFGAIGWRSPVGTAGANAFDIAKVFAGAIVGSAGVTIKSAVVRRH